MVHLQVWEAVGELNERSTLGRAVVNPPERKAVIRSRLMKEAWHLCTCGRAFTNIEAYDSHKGEHSHTSFKQTWLSPQKLDVSSVKRKVPFESDPKVSKKFKIHSSGPGAGQRQSNSIKSIKKYKANVAAVVQKYIQVKEVYASMSNSCIKSQKSNKAKKKHEPTKEVMNNVSEIKCRKCGREFMKLGHLRVHLRQTHRIKLQPLTSAPISCKMCPMTFKSSGGFKQHMRVHGFEGNYNCPQCSKNFHSANTLQMHTQKHHAKPYTLSSNQMSSNNQKLKVASKPSAVIVVPKPFENKNTDKAVLAVVNPNLEPKLEEIKEPPAETPQLSVAELLKYTSTRSGNHLKLANGIRDKSNLYKCPHCRRSLYTKLSLSNHISQRHPNITGVESPVSPVYHLSVPLKRKARTPLCNKVKKKFNSIISPINPASNKKLRSSTLNGENHTMGEKCDEKPLEVHHREEVVQLLARKKKIEHNSSNGVTLENDLFYDAIGTRTRSKNNASPEESKVKNEVEKIDSIEIGDESSKTVKETISETVHEITSAGQHSLFDCEKCGLPFRTARGLTQHEKCYHAQTVIEIPCKICPSKFTTETDLQKHMVNHSIKLMYKKFKFGMNGPIISERTRPRIIKQEKPPPLPENCTPDVIIIEDKKSKPVKTHSGDKCGYCGQIFFDRSVLWPHLKECRGTAN